MSATRLVHGVLINTDSRVRKRTSGGVLGLDTAQGRTNKLVDGCYSFWQGGVFPLISM